jgi:A1 cistron-splicing factor AAR2
MIPPGVHAITYAASGKNGAFGPITAVITSLAGRQIFILRWDAAEEVMERIQDELALRLTDAVRTFRFDPELAPYDLASYSTWCRLTNQISPQVIERVLPAGGSISNLSEPDSLGVMTQAEAALAQQLKHGNDSSSKEKASSGDMPPNAGRCHYTPLPRLIKRQGLTPTELTALNLDKSTALEEIIAETFDNKQEDFIGESNGHLN